MREVRSYLRTPIVAATVAAIVLAGCSSGSSSDDSAADDDAAGDSTTTTLPDVDNFIEDPLLAQAVVDKMVGPDTPITALSFSQEAVSVQERGQTDAFVVFRPVGPDELGPTTTTTEPGSEESDEQDEDAPPPVKVERGVTVLRSEMSPEEYEELSAEVAAIEERNSQVVSQDATEPLDNPDEPYRFGETRADTWSYSASSGQATRTPVELRSSDIETLLPRTFYTSEVDWTAFKPLMLALLAELDLGDTESITSVTVSKNQSNPELGLVVSISAEGERGNGSLSVVGGKVSIQRG